MKKLKCASFFAGVGGIDLGFSKFCDTIYANENDSNAIITFKNNFDIDVDSRDIRDVLPNDIPHFDIMLAGFPCQAFSIAGYREGFNDKKGRGNLFFELERILLVKKPKIIFLENVKNLETHDNGKTMNTILNSLHRLGYFVKYRVLNSMQYGNIPQNRERIYIVGFLDENLCNKFDFPTPIDLNVKLTDIIDKNVDDKYFYNCSKFKHFEELEKNVTNMNAIYQWRRKYVRENKLNVCPTLTANMGIGGHNVPIILTLKECFKFQGFPKSFKLPNISDTHLYKQAGNSVSVPVIEIIAKCIFDLF